MTPTSTETKTSAAEKAWATATKATAAANDALGPARENLQAARDAHDAADREVFAALTAKVVDPAAAKERIEKARAAVKMAEDDLQWAALQLGAAETVHEQAHEQDARRAVTVAEYETETAAFNNPQSRERVLVEQLASTVTELVVLISDRKDRHDRLAQEWEHLPPEQRPRRTLTTTSTRTITELIAFIPPEVAATVKAALAAAEDELNQRRRAQRFS
jgi:hypothetical protein